MRRGSGGEWESAGTIRFRKNGDSKDRDKKRLRTVLAKYRQRSQTLRKSAIPKHATAAMRVAMPPVERAISPISCRGLSQKSMVSKSGPDKYHPSHRKTMSLIALCLMRLIVTAQRANSKWSNCHLVKNFASIQPLGVSLKPRRISRI
jgi:hypothetical protein